MSIIKITTGVAFLILGCCLFLPAQNIFLPARNNYQVQRFTTDNGLPSNGIKGLQYDEGTGFCWIATESGVTRYNGADFVTFSKDNMPEMFSGRMLFLLKNQEGRIFTSDEAGDIFFVMQNRLQFLGQVGIDARPSTFKLIGLMASGRLFRQSARQPPANFGFNFPVEGLIPLSERRIILFHKDSLYDYRLGTRDPVFLASVEPDSRVFSLGGQLFVFNAANGFYRLDPDDPRKVAVPVSNTIPPPLLRRTPGAPAEHNKTLLFWENGMKNPILVSGPNAWTLEYSNGRLVPILICSAIPTDALLVFLKYNEKSQTLFLGTDSRGIVIIRKNAIRPVKKTTTAPDPTIRPGQSTPMGPAITPNQSTACYSQLRLPNGAVQTNQGQLLGGPARPPFQWPVSGPFNNFVYTTPDSVLWYSQNDSIISWSYHTHRRVSIYAGEGSITDGFVLSEGDLYIANAIGIGLIRDGRVDYLYTFPKADINSNAPFAMIELSPGLIAIASCNGLFRFNTANRRIDTLLQMPGICIRALWKYQGYLFIGTYGKGIYLYRNGLLRPIPSDKMGYLQYAHCFVPDKLGYCWISTNKGLFRGRPEDMIDAFEKGSDEIYYHYYGRADGLEMTELNGGCTPCALALNDTTISFPSMDGLAWLDPNRSVSQLPEGALYIDDLSADGRRVNITALWWPDLPSNTRDLVFSLGYPAWAGKENLYIEYKLEPWLRDWQTLEAGNDPKIFFSNLPSGNYRLMLRKRNGFGPDNYSYLEKSFRIEPRWYQQPWAWLLSLCLLTGFVIGIVWLRTRQFRIRQDKLEKQIAEKTRELQAKNEELENTDHIKTRLISIISHDLVTPLKFLHLTGKSLIEKKEMLPEALQLEAITEITTTSKELELLSTNILNWIKYRNEDRRLAKENFNLHALVSQLFGIFNAMARSKQIQLINEVDKMLMPYQFIEPVKIVLYNLIMNAINFTHEGHILVSSLVMPDGIHLMIEDTGVGMTQDQINNIMADHFIISSANVDNRKGNGLGYLIIKDLLKIIRGSLTIKSEKGKGAIVTVRFPV